MLKNNDIDFNKKIKIIDNNYGSYYINTENKISNINKYDVNNEVIKNINIKCLTDEEVWELKKNILFEYCNIFKKIPEENIIYNNQKIGHWYKSQKIKIKNNLIDNNFIYNELIKNNYIKNDLLKINNTINLLEQYGDKELTSENLVKKNISYYKCFNCNYQCKTFNDMIKHLNRQTFCKKSLLSYNYTDEELIKLSLIPYINNIQNINIHLIREKLKNIKNKISKKEYFEQFNIIEKNKLRNCTICNKKFNRKYELKFHLILECVNIDSDNIPEIKYISLNNTTNLSNEIENKEVFSKKIVNENIKNKNHLSILIPFDNNWDVSLISTEQKSDFIISIEMYKKLLQELLKNKINLNVILDKKKDFGMVYKNDSEKYIEMKSNDIIYNTMDKLNKCLLEMNKNADYVYKDIITFSRQMINKKYIDYQKDDKLHSDVSQFIKLMFDNIKDDAISIAKDILKTDEIPKCNGY
jgi:hypothetical protein